MYIMFPEIGSRFLTSSTVVKGLENKVLSWTSRDMKEMQKLVMMIFTISVDQEHNICCILPNILHGAILPSLYVRGK